MSNLFYKNPISPIQVPTSFTVSREKTFGTNFSVLSVGGYMEVYNLSDLVFTIPVGQTGNIELSTNIIPIHFKKSNGSVFSYDVLTLNSDNISSGRRRLGMLVYVYETKKIYQYTIENYDTLWSAATGATGPGGKTVVISDFGTTVKNNTVAGQNFINSWTASTIEDVDGYTNLDSTWRELKTGGGSGTTTGDYLPLSGGTVTGDTIFQSGLTANTISATTYFNLPDNVTGYYLPLSGGTVSGNTIFQSGVTGNTLTSVLDGSFNGIRIGKGRNETSNLFNLGIGNQTFNTGTTGQQNTAVGYFSLRNLTGGSFNSAYGLYSMDDSISSSNNTAIGYESLRYNNGSQNTAIGFQSLQNAGQSTGNTATYNVANGYRAGRFISSGSFNSILGNIAMVNQTTGSGNTAMGYAALAGSDNSTSTNNVAIGYTALRLNSSGVGNVAIGNAAGENELGSNKLYIHNNNSSTPLIGGDFSTGQVIINSGLTVNTISATTYQNLPSATFTGGTVAGETIFTNGLTANTISATTYQNLPVDPDTFVTGFTLSSNTITLSQNRSDGYSSFTISLSAYTGSSSTSGTYLPLSGGTVTGGTIFQSGLTANTISATTYQNLPTDIRTTGGTYSNNTFTFTNNTGGTYSVLFNTVTGLTVNGNLTVTGNTSLKGLTATTISATTYNNLPNTLYTGNGALSGNRVVDIDGYTLNFSGSGATDNLVLSGGNAGIGKLPSYKLDVNGDINFPTTTGSTYGIIRQNGNRILHTYGTNNLFLGRNSGNFTTLGVANVGVGGFSLQNNSVGTGNVGVGFNSLNQNTLGNYNIGIGQSTLGLNAYGENNVAIGSFALSNTDVFMSGSGNVAIGHYAGYSETGSNKLHIANNSSKTLIYGEFDNNRVGINTTSLSNAFTVSATTDPIKLQGIQTGTDTELLTIDGSGVVHKITTSSITPFLRNETNSGATDTITINQSIFNPSNLTVLSASTFIVDTNADYYILGDLYNSGAIIVNGTLKVGGVIYNSGTITGSGIIE